MYNAVLRLQLHSGHRHTDLCGAETGVSAIRAIQHARRNNKYETHLPVPPPPAEPAEPPPRRAFLAGIKDAGQRLMPCVGALRARREIGVRSGRAFFSGLRPRCR